MLKNLKDLRKKFNVSQQVLGNAIGVTQQSINKYENNNVEPDIYTLKLLADYFNTSIDYVVGYTDIEHKIEQVSDTALNDQELSHIKNYRKLDSDEKQSIDCVITNYIKNKKIKIEH